MAAVSICRADTHLFILSGQSNMSYLNEKASFIPTVTAGLPDDKTVTVKKAFLGQAITGWTEGDRPLYGELLAEVAAAGCKPDTITFCWMQGETDAMAGDSEPYETRLLRLIENLRADLDFPDMGFVTGRLNGCRGEHWDRIRAAQVSVAESDPRGAWVDTDDLMCDSGGVHFTVGGYEQLGARFATAAVKLAAGVEAEPAITSGIQESHEKPDDTGGCFCSTISWRDQ